MPQAKGLLTGTTDVLGHNRKCSKDALCCQGAYVKCKVTLVLSYFYTNVRFL